MSENEWTRLVSLFRVLRCTYVHACVAFGNGMNDMVYDFPQSFFFLSNSPAKINGVVLSYFWMEEVTRRFFFLLLKWVLEREKEIRGTIYYLKQTCLSCSIYKVLVGSCVAKKKWTFYFMSGITLLLFFSICTSDLSNFVFAHGDVIFCEEDKK